LAGVAQAIGDYKEFGKQQSLRENEDEGDLGLIGVPEMTITPAQQRSAVRDKLIVALDLRARRLPPPSSSSTGSCGHIQGSELLKDHLGA
jgi:hypothetical protein